MKPYDKPALTFETQLEHLERRGLTIGDREHALATFSHISYYRLSAYGYPFRIRDDQNQVTNHFADNTNLTDALTLYEFDRKLRLLIMDAIERIEVSIRTQLTYVLAHTFGAFGHTNTKNFNPQFKHMAWLSRLDDEVQRSREEFIRHFQQSYQGFPRIPIWMTTEIISFGALSKLYKGLKHEHKCKVADAYALHHKTLTNWMHVLTYIRNVCAHHNRLWNRELAIRPRLRSFPERWQPPHTPGNDRIFIILLMLNHLLKAGDNGDDWRDALFNLITPVTTLPRWVAAMGFPEQWKEHSLW